MENNHSELTPKPLAHRCPDGADISHAPIGPQPLRKDEEYFMNDVVTFQVENVLFRVPPSKLIRESSTFASTFALIEVDGTSTKKTVIIPIEVRAEDFRLLLTLLYPRPPTFSQDEWISILRLSSKWFFLAIRELAIAQIKTEPGWSQMNPTEKLVLGREFSIGSWVAEGYRSLLRRESTLTNEDVSQLGYQISVELLRMREQTKAGLRPQMPQPFKLMEEITEIVDRESAYKSRSQG